FTLKNNKHYSYSQTISGHALENPNTDIGFCGRLLVGLTLILTLPFSIWMCMVVTIIFRLWRLLSGGAKGPGLYFILPCTDNFINVDMRTITFDIPPQEVLTRHSVTVCVDGVVYYWVQNPTLAVANVTYVNAAIQLLAQTTLRKNLTDSCVACLPPRATLDSLVEIKDVKLLLQLQRAIAAEAEATGEVIAVEGEMKASRALKEASLVIAESLSALQLRYLQTLNTIAAEKNSTIVFPLPMKILHKFVNG
uniref:Stomatin n=1 Tax=Amphilophus citrinellus TaxID=61819 RepID=A0A3Q0QWG3_AMPCI